MFFFFLLLRGLEKIFPIIYFTFNIFIKKNCLGFLNFGGPKMAFVSFLSSLSRESLPLPLYLIFFSTLAGTFSFFSPNFTP